MTTTADQLLAQARQQISEISPDEARERLDHGGIALDIREADEFDSGHIPDAVHIPRGFLEFKAPKHEALQAIDTPVCVYCQGGGRAALATQSLQQLGYTNVASIKGGFKAWQEAGQPSQIPSARDEEE